MNYIVINNVNDLSKVIGMGMNYAYPLENEIIRKAVIETIRDGANYCGGALFEIENGLYQIMYK